MTDARRLARELLEHARFQEDLGVKWVRRYVGPRKAGARRTEPDSPVRSGGENVAVPSRRQPVTPVRIMPQTRSMFDPVPSEAETLGEIRTDLGDCQRCKLALLRKNIVFGSGNPRARLMFVGEAPGADEDEQGLPFVGRAGQLLTKIIESIGMRREDVYICNILKCRPPGNRNPESDEIASCQPFLFRQIQSVRPTVICALGTFGAQTLLGTKEAISRLRGTFFEYRGAKLLATFHPAYLLRNPHDKRKVWEDVQKIRDYLNSLPPNQ